MSRNALRTLHAAASTLGLVIVALFLLSSLAAEVLGDPAGIVRVKTAIFRALFVLAPVMAVAGATGSRLAGPSRAPVIQRKMRRMRLAGINALLVLVPCAVTLYWLAIHGRFGAAFTAVQVVELMAGAANLVLLGLNLRDGLAMRSARLRGARASTAPARAGDDSLAGTR